MAAIATARAARDTRIDRIAAYLLGFALTTGVAFSGWTFVSLRDDVRAIRDEERSELAKLTARLSVVEAIEARIEKRLDADAVRK